MGDHNSRFSGTRRRWLSQATKDVYTERGVAEGTKHAPQRLPCLLRLTILAPQLLQEVETQALVSQQKIQETQAQLNARKREARLNQLTSNELATLSKDTNVYEGVGKM